ncbi:hypothetical protein [[Kitasatospora] papulosa]|uniref:hypothetical protein n=1 Tax=[Kitasatospora] papulosa TaxID=1464011 RepID=UPI003696123C
MASTTLPAKVKTSKATVDEDDYEGPSRSTVATLLALLVGVLSLVDYFLHGFGAAVAHLAYFGGVVLAFRVFFGLAFGSADTDTEPEASP